ncbi:hypothetical protein ACLMJK_008624 [Lecanora helva]
MSSTQNSVPQSAPTNFLLLPPELRIAVYQEYFSSEEIIFHSEASMEQSSTLKILDTSHQIRDEALQVLASKHRLPLDGMKPHSFVLRILRRHWIRTIDLQIMWDFPSPFPCGIGTHKELPAEKYVESFILGFFVCSKLYQNLESVSVAFTIPSQCRPPSEYRAQAFLELLSHIKDNIPCTVLHVDDLRKIVDRIDPSELRSCIGSHAPCGASTQ